MEERKYNKKEIENGKVLALLSYIGVLSLIPFLAEKDNNFVKYHAKQGVNLFIIEIIAYAVSYASVLLLIGFLLVPLVGLCSLALSIFGIVNVLNGEAKELPIIGSIKIIK